MKIISDENYDILLGFDIDKDEVKKRVKSLTVNASKVLFVIDNKVSEEFVNKVFTYFDGVSIYTYYFNACEENKTLITFTEINAYLTSNCFTRSDLIVSIGGGVTSDIVGYVASSFKRGIKDIYFPTTTLAMIDASVGGKCGINFLDTKNVIGAFYDPSLIVMDLNSLKSLDKRNYYNGLVEALKMGLTIDANLYNEFIKNEFDIERIIDLSIRAKIKVVSNDRFDKGGRDILNFGHSIAHAIELNSDYYHGEAVAIGIVNNILNEELKNNVITILKKMEIDIKKMNVENIDIKSLNLSNDKKVVNGVLKESFLLDLEKVEYKDIEL